MHPTGNTTHLETIISSGAIQSAKREPDFLKRAQKLFHLLEDVFTGFDKDRTASDQQRDAEMSGRMGWVYGIGIVAGIACAVGSGPFIFGLAFGAIGAVEVALFGGMSLVVGALGGVLSYLLADTVARSGPDGRKELRDAQNDNQLQTLTQDIDREISGMDRNLFSQPSDVRSEFRDAFEHAALKRKIREEREHRAVVEENARATRAAAETASTMATVAAVNSIMAATRPR